MLMSARRGETLTPNPNECNSTLTSGTNNIYPYPYIDINDRGHSLRITHMHRLLWPFDRILHEILSTTIHCVILLGSSVPGPP